MNHALLQTVAGAITHEPLWQTPVAAPPHWPAAQAVPSASVVVWQPSTGSQLAAWHDDSGAAQLIAECEHPWTASQASTVHTS
ncbi:MAG: hypothetical protein QM723_34445 [Myxococcaceae bacterium]